MQKATLRQLRAFSLVARHHSFSRAASELHLTPSAVSLQIKELEHALGVAMFGRGGKPTALTPAGELLLDDVNRALCALKEAGTKLQRLRGQESAVVSIGMVSNAKYLLMRLLSDFRAAYPNVELHVSVGNRDTLLRQLGHHEVDFAVMGSPPLTMDIRCEKLAALPLAIVASPAHRLTGRHSLSSAELAACEFIVREPGSGTRAAMERYFQQEHISPARVMESNNNGSIKQAVIANMGVAFVPLHSVRLELELNMLIVLDVVGLPLIRHWCLLDMLPCALGDSAKLLHTFIVKGCAMFLPAPLYKGA